MPKIDALARRRPIGDGGRWQLYSICNLTQFLAILRKYEQFYANSRKQLQFPASYSKTEELPPALRKPLCELDLHRGIR
ncbi:MAG: hypothetical protein ACLQNE_05475 [Thermoguttaceae bacterium]